MNDGITTNGDMMVNLEQTDIPEYDITTEYFYGDIAREPGTSFIYQSVMQFDINRGNALSSGAWLLCGEVVNGLVKWHNK